MANSRILAAFAASDPSYLAKCLEQRQPGEGGAGSRFLQSTTLDQLQGADWAEYSHPEIKSPACGFRAPVPGRLGIIKLADLDPQAEVFLDDRKGTGKVTPVVVGVLGPQVDFTVLLLGPDREPGKEVVWTFFPGEPINPSQVDSKDFPHGTTVSVAKAIGLGLEWAKIG